MELENLVEDESDREADIEENTAGDEVMIVKETKGQRVLKMEEMLNSQIKTEVKVLAQERQFGRGIRADMVKEQTMALIKKAELKREMKKERGRE